MRSGPRRVAKAIWWVATPWLTAQRLRFIRERAKRSAEQGELRAFIDIERARTLERQQAGVGACEALDLSHDDAAGDAAGLPRAKILWSPQDAKTVVDRWSAARFCIDLLRTRPELHRSFPQALSGGLSGGFAAWLDGEEGRQLALGAEARRHISALFTSNVAGRARQAFMADEDVRAVLPQGLTPCGHRSLFKWFMRHGRHSHKLRLEEVWWLHLEAAENPRLELWRAYLFTPEWQQRFPDGLTIFGRNQFAEWFAAVYGAVGAWVDASAWPAWQSASIEIRLGYCSRPAWREACPDAFRDGPAARSLLAWLASPEAGLPLGVQDCCRQLDVEMVAAELLGIGVNVIGHFCYPSGLRVSVESLVEGLAAVDVQTSLRDVRTDAKDDPRHICFDGTEVFDVTIIHTQPEPFFGQAYQRADFLERIPRTYRIAYWYWEFDSIPESWLEYARQIDEVWVATEFVARGLRKRLSIPVKTLFPGVKLAPFISRDRTHFGLDSTHFIFLFTFHMMSIMERKNPLGLIRAFKSAFQNQEKVTLVLKTSFGDRHPAQMRELKEAAVGANVTIIDQVYSADEVLSLMDTCDAYVSLHRSEGLGLTMAEAMLMGKPVIATNFSGNVDFMNENNSLLVPYDLVKVGKEIPPYDSGLDWAEPSIVHASQYMRQLFDDRGWGLALGKRAKSSAEKLLSIEAGGRRSLMRLVEIKNLPGDWLREHDQVNFLKRVDK